MANIVNPNLPADLPTDWTTSQYVSPNGSEVSLSQQHGYNYLMEQVNAAQTAVNTLAEQAQEAVSGLESGALTATAARSGTTVAITGPEDAVTVTFLAPADWTEGDSYTYNGTPITVTDLNGNPVTDGWKQGAVLTFQISGSVAYFVGGASGSFLPLSGGTMTGPAVGAPGGSTIPQFRNVYYGTEALTPGSSPLPEGTLYITPEMEYEGAGKRTCRFVVGTSTAGWTAADCDYLCDGTADDVEINAAIQALPSTGGEIVILDGTYNITATILINKNNVVVRGNGTSTKINKNFVSDSSNNSNLIYIRSPYCTVRDLLLDFNYTDTDYVGSSTLFVSAKYCLVFNCVVINSRLAIRADNAAQDSCICNNTVINAHYGIAFYGYRQVVSNNILYDILDRGMEDGSKYQTITDNVIYSEKATEESIGVYLTGEFSVFSGNLINGNFKRGMWITSRFCCISNNIIYNFSMYGIYTNSGISNNVSGNTVTRGSGTPSDYTDSQYTIYAVASSASNNLFTGNNIMGKNYVDNGTNNTWANNKFE